MWKKILKIILVFLFFSFFNFNTFAESNVLKDYTLIDCLEWNDSSWIAFDSNKPFQTLKWWIEKTISYINSNINKVWNELTASWIIFNVKINCTALNLLDWKILLNFNWNKYNNELVIEWIGENSFIVKDTYFYLQNETWNIIFDNVNFELWNKYNYYFYAQDWIPKFYSSWIKIRNSNINLKNWFNLAYDKGEYYSLVYVNWNRRRYTTYYFYSNQQLIYNSNIKIELDWDYNFAMPIVLKDSKLEFINSWTWAIYNIKFLPTYSSTYITETNFSTFISNEIDLWWNNFSTLNDEKIAFINNKFFNFNEFIFWNDLININKTIFINNSILNNIVLNISKSLNLFNNVFNSDFIDTYDLKNYRRNYLLENLKTEWISWIFKRNYNYKYFNLDFSSSSLYKEITWNDIPKSLGEIYIIYQ